MMSRSVVLENMITEVMNSGFTANQMRTMMCAMIDKMALYEIEAMLDSIGMSTEDVAENQEV